MTQLFRQYKQEFVIIFITCIFILIAVPFVTYLYFARDLASKETIMNRKNTGVVLLDRNNIPFFTFYSGKTVNFVKLSQISDYVKKAVVASEDKEFYQHQGFSIRGILRSIYLDILKKDMSFGGSTITQQLVKNALLNSKKSFLRKYQEIVLASEIERRYSKDEILEMYLNSVYFGKGAFGIQQASQVYFGKNANQLTLAEAAMLVGLLPAPSRLSPLSGNFQKAKIRQKKVIESMYKLNLITLSEKTKALEEKLNFISSNNEINDYAPHFALMVLDELRQKYGEENISRSGFKVQTTLNLSWQIYAEKVVKDQVNKLARNKVTNGAVVVIDPKTGEILVLVGSKDWFDNNNGKINMAISPRSPGSAFKPLIYAGAFEKQIITPGTVLHDVPTTFQGNYKPKNYDGRFRGNVLPRRALANSLNIPAVEVMNNYGVEEGIKLAKKFGITSLKDPSHYGLSFVLGTGEVSLLEMTNAYAVFANNGIYNKFFTILKITDKENNIIYTHKPYSERIISNETSFLISSILSDKKAREEVFGYALNISKDAAVKTGTSQNYKDALTIGYTPSLVVGVWVGNNDNSPMDNIAGSLGAAPIWRILMEKFLSEIPTEQFVVPNGIIQVRICSHNGYILRNDEATSSALTEYFIAGTQPRQYCTFPKKEKHDEQLQEIKID